MQQDVNTLNLLVNIMAQVLQRHCTVTDGQANCPSGLYENGEKKGLRFGDQIHP